MDYRNIIQAMKDIGFPCVYGSFASPPELPYTIVVFTYSADMMADNQNYSEIGNYQLELYHNIKHPPSEMLIQNKLKELRLPYTKVEAFIDSEKLYQVVYDFQLLGG